MRIELFHSWDCPYSARVRDFVERNRLRDYVDYVDVDDEIGAEERLERETGSTTTPCLLANGRAVRDGTEIIAWLRHYFLADRPAPALS